jgi:hypothetical protein
MYVNYYVRFFYSNMGHVGIHQEQFYTLCKACYSSVTLRFINSEAFVHFPSGIQPATPLILLQPQESIGKKIG